MEQTVAEAVAAATQQQQAAAQQAQQLISQPSPPVQPVQTQSSTIDNLTCQWQGCGERCDSAEALYVRSPSWRARMKSVMFNAMPSHASLPDISY